MAISTTPHSARRVLWVLFAGLLTTLHPLSVAMAQNSTSASAGSEAKRLFAQGSALYLAQKYEAALGALMRSYDLVASPNSELVIARCLRELGRLVEAKEAFAVAEDEARRRTEEGSAKYKQTMETAAVEGAAVRGALGTIRVQVEGGGANAKLEVDGVSSELPEDGDLVVWHAPGEVTVAFRAASGAEQKQTVTVRAGAEVTVGFGGSEPAEAQPVPAVAPPPASPPPPPAPAARDLGVPAPRASWATPAAIVSGSLAVLGAGGFVGFGLDSQAVYTDLKKRCGNTCGPGNRQEAQRGKTEQLVANLSLVVGSVSAAATIAFVVVAVSNPARAGTRSASWRVVVAGSGLSLAGEFE